MRTFKKALGGLLISAIVIIGLFSISEATYQKRIDFGKFGVYAGETLAVGNIVYLKDSDGEAYKADGDDTTKIPAVGIAATIGGDGEMVSIVRSGIFSGWSSLTEGSPCYLSTTAGAITQTAPATGLKQVIGYAISTTEIFFDFNNAQASYFTIALTHDGQETATLDPVFTFQMPFAAVLSEVSTTARDIDTVDTDETYTIDLEEAGTTVLSSAISIAADNTPVVGTISDTAIADNAKMEVVLTLGGTTPTIDDLTVLLVFKKPVTQY